MSADSNYITHIEYIPTEKKLCGIYKIQTPDHKYYIGSSRDCWKRYQYHLNTLKKGIHCNPKLQRRFLSYTETPWTFEVLELCEESKLLEVEQLYLSRISEDTKALNCNFTATVPPSQKGNKRSLEQKRHLSSLYKGRKRPPLTAEHKQKLSESHKGKVFTEEHKQNLQRAAVRTDSVKTRISLKLKGRKIPPLTVWKRLVTRFMTGRDLRLNLTDSQIIQLIECDKLDSYTVNYLKTIRNL